MATYADWAASRQSTPVQSSNGPVKLVIDSQGNVVQDMSSNSASTGFDSGMMEETHMSVDDPQEVVQKIRARTRSDGSNGVQPHSLPAYPATLNEQQKAWSAKDLPASAILLVIDTNWLLSHLKLFVQIEQLIPRNDSSFAPVVFIVPYIVLKELDGLKHARSSSITDTTAGSRHTPTMAQLSRTASTFVLDKLTHRPDLFRGQRPEEGGVQSVVPASAMTNDELVLDCCRYFQQQGYQVGLLSDDKILCSQATVAGLVYMNFTPEDAYPEAFLAKLHPDLPPYLQRLRAASTSGTNANGANLGDTPQLTLEAFASKTAQMQQDLLDQQMTAIALLEHNFPLMPPELLQVISVVTNSLLTPVIFLTLLHHMANDNLEIFAYMLKRSSIFYDFPFSTGNDEEVLDCSRWNAGICLRLIDQNWQGCFADKAGKTILPPSSGTSTSSSTFTFSDRTKAPSSTSTNPCELGGSSLTQSRWASSPSSSFGPRRNFSPSSSHSSSKANSSFHPSKLPALAKAFASTEDDIIRWWPARWRLVLEDLELLLCRTSILNDVTDGRQKAELLLNAARKNVDTWKASSGNIV